MNIKQDELTSLKQQRDKELEAFYQNEKAINGQPDMVQEILDAKLDKQKEAGIVKFRKKMQESLNLKAHQQTREQEESSETNQQSLNR